MREFPEQDKVLYKWKLTEDYRILKYSTNRWEQRTFGMGTYKYESIVCRWGNNSSLSYIKPNELDIFSHSRYYSFEDNDEKVKEIILKSFVAKVQKAQNDLDRNTRILEEFKRNNM